MLCGDICAVNNMVYMGTTVNNSSSVDVVVYKNYCFKISGDLAAAHNTQKQQNKSKKVKQKIDLLETRMYPYRPQLVRKPFTK